MKALALICILFLTASAPAQKKRTPKSAKIPLPCDRMTEKRKIAEELYLSMFVDEDTGYRYYGQITEDAWRSEIGLAIALYKPYPDKLEMSTATVNCISREIMFLTWNDYQRPIKIFKKKWWKPDSGPGIKVIQWTCSK